MEKRIKPASRPWTICQQVFPLWGQSNDIPYIIWLCTA